MADYSIISDVSAYLVQLLRQKLCPDPISSPNSIEIATPLDQDTDFLLGLYLYDFTMEGEVSAPPFVPTGRLQLRRAARPYSLFYMLFPNCGLSNTGLKAGVLQQVLGRAAQIMSDLGSISSNSLQPWLEAGEPPIAITSAKLSLEDKVRVWTALDKPYQISLFYKAAPVFLSSEAVVDTPRVTDARFILSPVQNTGGEP